MFLKRNYFVLCLFFFTAQLLAQDHGKFIFSYGNQKVFQDEFERAFSKNNNFEKQGPSDSAIQEYLDLYVKFKLKVAEAYRQKLDTQKSFKNELAGYRKQLAQPYLVDKESNEKLVQEAYQRYLMEVNASHIMISLPSNPTPSDTQKAYLKAMRYYEQIVSGELNFDSTAYNYSEDRSAKLNYGNLGYFTAFSMIYPFENVAFSTPINGISKPFKTRFGYHIVKVHDKRKSLGKIKVAHIMKRFNKEEESSEAKIKIDEIYKRLNNGEPFESLVSQFSEDFNSRKRGGTLQGFRYTDNNIPLEFRDAAFSLKNDGDFSKPIKTKYSWHIIKRIELNPIGSFEMLEDQIKLRVSRDGRNALNKSAMIARLIKENGIVENPTQIDKTFGSIAKDSVSKSNWKPSDQLYTNEILFSIQKENYTQGKFVDYIKSKRFPKNQDIHEVLSKYYKGFKDECVMTYEEENLEKKYPDFKNLMQEYEEGILLFELMDKEIWSKASQDSTGLIQFFEQNRNQYYWEERVDIDRYIVDPSIAKKVQKAIKKNKEKTWILEKFNKNNPLAVSVTGGLYEKSKEEFLKDVQVDDPIKMIDLGNGQMEIFHTKNTIPKTRKELEETKGLVTADYQKYLEDMWIKKLKQLYPIKLNQEGIQQLFKSN